jgi:hypothetical protein
LRFTITRRQSARGQDGIGTRWDGGIGQTNAGLRFAGLGIEGGNAGGLAVPVSVAVAVAVSARGSTELAKI